MELKDIKFVTILSGFIGLILASFAMLNIIGYGIGTSWRTVLGLIFNVLIIVGSIAVFVSAKNITTWSMKKFLVIYLTLVFFCIAHDLVFLTLVNLFPAVMFQFSLLLIHRYRKKNSISPDGTGA